MNTLTSARWAFRRTLLVLFGFSLMVNLLMLTMPFYMLQIYERVLPSRNEDTLTFLTIIAIAALMVLGALEAVRGIVAARAAARLETDLGGEAMRASVLLGKQTGGEIQPLRDLATVRGFIGSRGVFALLDAPFAPIFIGLMWLLHPILFWLTLGGAVVLVGLAILNQWLTSTGANEALSKQVLAMRTATAMAQNEESLRAMGMTHNGISVWGADNAQAMIAQDTVDRRNALLTGLSRTIRMILQIAILGVGGWLALRNEVTPGVIFAASLISGRGLQPIDQIIGAWKQTLSTKSAWTRLSELLGRLPDEIDRTQMPKPKGEITAEGLRVLPPRGTAGDPILAGLSFPIPAGDVLGIVGPSGSGKSTLARILVGAQIPDSGVVRIDGTDIKNWDPEQIGADIGYLSQEVRLFPGTIKQNIARLAAEPDDAAVLEAARKAQVHELIQSLPQGYETLVGAGHFTPSVGQRQRIALARAFYGNPQIMVLDEPNANLDDDGELALRRAIAEARKNGATIVVVTQRKQILIDMKHILRIRNGKIDFHGTNEDYVKALQEVRNRARATHEKALQASAVKAPTQKQNPFKGGLSLSSAHTAKMGRSKVGSAKAKPNGKSVDANGKPKK